MLSLKAALKEEVLQTFSLKHPVDPRRIVLHKIINAQLNPLDKLEVLHVSRNKTNFLQLLVKENPDTEAEAILKFLEGILLDQTQQREPDKLLPTKVMKLLFDNSFGFALLLGDTRDKPSRQRVLLCQRYIDILSLLAKNGGVNDQVGIFNLLNQRLDWCNFYKYYDSDGRGCNGATLSVAFIDLVAAISPSCTLSIIRLMKEIVPFLKEEFFDLLNGINRETNFGANLLYTVIRP